MRIAFFLRRHRDPAVSPIIPEVVHRLAGRGVDGDAIYPEEDVTDLGALRPEHDLYVLKSRTETTLSIAGALDAAGAVILNPYRVAVACRNKVVASQLLRAAGVPLPEAYVAGHLDQLRPLLETGPLVVKPYRGSQGRGVRLVRTPDELVAESHGEGPVFAQRYYEPVGRDRKIYRIGDQIFGVKRVWPARTYEEKLGEAFPVDAELRDLALRLGAALGITLYGFDVVQTEQGPYVVDFSPFPGFKGVPDAAALLADYIYDAAARVVDGRALVAAGTPEPLPA
jgi:ribosomal protein S6--L-glutamate ligase